jgi:hypothetical protein
MESFALGNALRGWAWHCPARRGKENCVIPIVAEAAAKVGGIAALARALNVRHPTFYRWRRVPAERVLQIEKATGISRHKLRPDLYPRK